MRFESSGPRSRRPRRTPQTRAIVVLLGAIALSSIGASVARADFLPLRERRLTNSTATQRFPDISGSRVVYEDDHNGNWDIYCYDLGSNIESRLTPNTKGQFRPRISGDNVVYMDDRVDQYHVYRYVFSASTEYPLTETGDGSYPSISGSRVAYQIQGQGRSDVYLTDLAIGKTYRISWLLALGTRGETAISGNNVVWEDNRSGNWDIYCYDIKHGTEGPTSTNGATQRRPAISGNHVVYEDDRNGDWDIYCYDLVTRTEKRLTSDPHDQVDVAISGNTVVWSDYRNSVDPDIYAYDLGTDTERVVTASASSQISPAIDGNRLVYCDWRSGNLDVFLYRMPLPSLTAITAPVVAYGARAKVSGYLKDDFGVPLGGRTVRLQTSTDDETWQTKASAITGSAGNYTIYSPGLTKAGYTRMRYDGDAVNFPTTSHATLVKPNVYLTAPTAPSDIGPIAFTSAGYLKPRHAAGTTPVSIRCYRRERQANGTYKYVLRKTFAAKAYDYYSYTAYRTRVTLLLRGVWMLRAYHPVDSLNAATTSAPRYVTVR